MTRTGLRTHVFKELYFRDFFSPEEYEKQCELYLSEEGIGEEDSAALKARAAAIGELIPEIDEKINGVAEHWKTCRMSKVDLSILRLAVYEGLYDDEIPEKVAYNEAVELAKKFGSDDSPSFINGILGKLSRKAGEEDGTDSL